MNTNQTTRPVPLARPQTSSANITAGTRTYFRALPPKELDLPTGDSYAVEDEEDFPTPRARPDLQRNPLSIGSPRRETFQSTYTQFEEYDEDVQVVEESELLPFQLSTSLKRKMKQPSGKLERPGSFMIPSPSLWPSIRHPSTSTDLPSQAPLMTPLSPLTLAALDGLLLQPPAAHYTPSLTEGSSVTDEAPSMSCPETPSLGSVTDDTSSWGYNFETSPLVGCELPPLAMKTLLRLSSENAPFEPLSSENALFDSSELPVQTQFSDDPYEMSDKGLSIVLNDKMAVTKDDDDELSPISIPSPGGFFSTLRKSSAELWVLPVGQSQAIDTVAPESYYSSPRQPSIQDMSETQDESTTQLSDDPLTARRLTFDLETLLGPGALLYEPEGNPFDREYTHKLSETAADHVNRTSDWIKNQESFMETLRRAETIRNAQSTQHMKTQSRPTTPAMKSHKRTASGPAALSSSINSTPSKKSVRFVDDIEVNASTPGCDSIRQLHQSDSVLYHAFQHLTAHGKARDAYLNRESRAEALRMQRRYRRDMHQQRLQGTFTLEDQGKKPKPWAHSGAPISEEEQLEKEQQRKTLVGNSKQRRALEQLDLNNWSLQAMRYLEGGALLPATAQKHLEHCLRVGQGARILDFGGQPTASWGWAAAVENRGAKIYTVIPNANGLKSEWLAHRGPSNHRIATVSNAWTLPFPAGFFDVVSARSLHTMLKITHPIALNGQDEWEATLIELNRVLAPGGIMHFSLLDAEVAAPSHTAIAAKSVEFAVALRTRGYDPCAGRHMLQRFAQAGFGDVQQSWVRLPWVSVEKQNDDAVTGLFGSVAWEQWLLKFQMEMGRPKETFLESIAEALDQARTLEGQGTGWRTLIGCATKAPGWL